MMRSAEAGAVAYFLAFALALEGGASDSESDEMTMASSCHEPEREGNRPALRFGVGDIVEVRAVYILPEPDDGQPAWLKVPIADNRDLLEGVKVVGLGAGGRD